ncbi:toll/interleukin-1 receptor domain-containing protein [Brevundimonas sp.]|uniref:toll/interleukin-1 receptor domain-containing protein n=1 Tax=Brevundimonas sp. TaxID=1871086 RepID=UPI002D641A31|nr:toll/interleukin-1 receptor domain-containing protein [Brevundimonas sp.]HYC75863.1 toll/interleukin-1 receptor domain-containing protein [Brevundimonas sp.]
MKRVFVSYGAPDIAIAQKIVRGLKLYGFAPLLFENDARPGQRLHRFMRDSIETSDAVILLCSRASLGRSGVINEIEQCLRREAKLEGQTLLYPIALDDFVFTDWNPSYPGFATEIRDRVIMSLPADSGRKAFKSGMDRLAQAIGDSLAPNNVRELAAHYTVDLTDERGHIADLTYRRLFRPLTAEVRHIDVQNFTSSGDVKFISANMGSLQFARDDGGQKRMAFVFDAPLDRGRDYEFVAKFLALDCHLENTETALFNNTRNYEKLSITVNFPPSRPATSARLIKVLGASRTQVPTSRIKNGGEKLSVTVPRPQPYATYILEWDW